MDILNAIGNTSMVRLKVAPGGRGNIFAKLEWESPIGSVQERIAQSVISRAEADGRLQPGPLQEQTSPLSWSIPV
jgi:cysteine synthase